MIITKTYKTIKAYLKANHTYDDLIVAKFIIENGTDAVGITKTKIVKMDKEGHITTYKMSEDEMSAYLANQ